MPDAWVKRIVGAQNDDKLLGGASSHNFTGPIPPGCLKQYDFNNALEKANMLENTPLLVYILMESAIFKKGEMLTGVGGIIVAEVILSILMEDCDSYFNSSEHWKPSLPSKECEHFTMGDLIRFIYCD